MGINKFKKKAGRKANECWRNDRKAKGFLG